MLSLVERILYKNFQNIILSKLHFSTTESELFSHQMEQNLQKSFFVIYVDDDEDDLFFVQDAFKKLAELVEVITFPNGHGALSFLQSLAPDQNGPCLIILDINMPRMNGKEVLLELRKMKRFKNVPVVLFSTSSQPRDKDFAQQHDVTFITKPVDFKEMDGIAQKFLKHCMLG